MTDNEIATIIKRLDIIDDKLDRNHEATTVLNTVVLGKNGDAGLVGKLEGICKSHDKLKSQVYMLIGILVGSGVITGGVLGVIKLVGS